MPAAIHPTSTSCEHCVLPTREGVDALAASNPLAASGEFFSKLLNTEGFPPRWECGTGWTPGHGWLHIISDFAIFGAYFAIPVVLAYFILRRKDIPFPPILWLFVAFIALCGMGHFIEATIFWVPWYRLSGLFKALTATVSWITVVALIRIVPQALNLPGLAVANVRLEQEIMEREAVEQELRKSYSDLQTYARSVVDREDRVIELKREVNALLDELHQQPRYSMEATFP